VLQGLTLRRPLAAVLWMMVNVLGVGIGVAVTIGVNIAVGPVNDVAARVVFGGLFGTSQGVIAASMLLWLLPKRFSDTSSLCDRRFSRSVEAF
jgi:hypothetical protein